MNSEVIIAFKNFHLPMSPVFIPVCMFVFLFIHSFHFLNSPFNFLDSGWAFLANKTNRTSY